MKFILFGLCLIFIFIKVKDTNLLELRLAFGSPVYFFSVALLFFPNYTFEVFKWRAVVLGIVPFTWGKLIKGVLTGQAVGLFAPLMSGDYTGRVLHLQGQQRHHVLGAYLASTFFQSLAATSLGTFATLALGVKIGWWSYGAAFWLAAVYAAIVGALLYVFKKSRRWHKKLPPKWQPVFDSYKTFDKKRMFGVLLFFALRYAVICFQFYFSYRAFGLEISFMLSTLATATILSAKNLFAGMGVLVELGVRQFTVAYVMESLGYDPALASLAGLWVWMVNVGMASLLGAIWVWKIKI